MLFSNMLLAREMGALYVDFKGKLGLSFYCHLRLNFCVFPFFTKLFWNPIDSYAIPTAVIPTAIPTAMIIAYLISNPQFNI